MSQEEVNWDYGKLAEAINEVPKDLIKDFDEERFREYTSNDRSYKIRRALEIIVPLAIILLIIFVL